LRSFSLCSSSLVFVSFASLVVLLCCGRMRQNRARERKRNTSFETCIHPSWVLRSFSSRLFLVPHDDPLVCFLPKDNGLWPPTDMRVSPRIFHLSPHFLCGPALCQYIPWGISPLPHLCWVQSYGAPPHLLAFCFKPTCVAGPQNSFLAQCSPTYTVFYSVPLF